MWFDGGRRLRYVWPLRVPLVSTALLVTWPWIAFSHRAHPYLSGLFDPVEPEALILIAVLALLIAWTNLIIACLVLTYGEKRFTLPPRGAVIPPKWWWWLAACALAAPVVCVAVSRVASTQEVNSVKAASLAAAGVVIAALLFGLAYGLQTLFAKFTTADFAPKLRGTPLSWPYRGFLWVLRRFPSFGDGFLTSDRKLAPGHGQAFCLAITSVLAYLATGYLTSDIHRPVLASTLAYLLMLQLMLTWLAGIAAFLFDRSRAPLFVFIAAGTVVVNYAIHPLWSTDHLYRTTPAPPSPGQVAIRISPAELLGGEPVSIVVAASGGGIQSAAWTARVLTGLAQQLPQFSADVRLISSVSGGSVGAMNVLASWPDCGPPLMAGERRDFDANAASRESSLHAVGWGLVFKDLPRTLLPMFSSPLVDRGSVLEDAWKREPRLQRIYPTPGPLLSSWRTNVAEHRCPGIIYNAMVAETGEPMLFSTVELPASLRSFDFYRRYPDRDLPMTTAARLSAGFPYVSPASRADVDQGHYAHVVDGGYFDNYGVVSLAALVHEALERAKTPPALRRILVLEICDTAECSGKESNGAVSPGGDKDQSWVYQVTAPLSAFMNMRGSAQRVNNREALRLLKAYWRTRGACIESVEASYDGADAPMSWHLTSDEKRAVDEQWQWHESQALTQAVIDFLYHRNFTTGPGGATSALCPEPAALP